VGTEQPDGVERRGLLRAILTALAAATALLSLYYLAPIQESHGSVFVMVAVGVVIISLVLAHEIRAILHHDKPVSRALVSLAIVIPLFIVVFAWIYLTMSRADPAAFGEPLSRTAALYFTVTILSTVGFGDITPTTDQARIVVTIQMVANAILLVVAVRLIFRTASRRSTQVRATKDERV
jgi:voltage-gated potassium channel